MSISSYSTNFWASPKIWRMCRWRKFKGRKIIYPHFNGYIRIAVLAEKRENVIKITSSLFTTNQIGRFRKETGGQIDNNRTVSLYYVWTLGEEDCPYIAIIRITNNSIPSESNFLKVIKCLFSFGSNILTLAQYRYRFHIL